ncbi:MAG: DNA polymerase III subunit gamma/tau [Candidatus Eisenbacteria bacterium]|nr:DNA polymerase III subunit gamma/tau [Candidatus Eisenbacteria bacterium]
MAHRALTLKYRPQVFSDLIGQDHVSSVLARALESNRVAHAFLLTGARGVGKTTSARILAKALNCEKRAAGVVKGADSCNACTSCTEITAGVSLDVVEIDGASNRGIADVQQLREKVRFAPATGKYRVVIIDEVHQLSGDAFAALLKTLEEPPPHLVFIFATTDPQKLPDTIRSRTQRFDFARVALRKVADRLLEITKRENADPEGVHFQLTDGAALLIAHKGEGSMRDSVSALDQVISAGETQVDEDLVRRVLGIADREAFFRLGEAITNGDTRATLHELHRTFEKGMDPRDLCEGLAEHFRAVLVLKVDPERGGELVAASSEDLERLKSQGAAWAEADLLRLVRIAAEAQWPMRDSPQPVVHLEAAVLQMATLERAESVALLLERLDALEQRLGAGGAPSLPSPLRAPFSPQPGFVPPGPGFTPPTPITAGPPAASAAPAAPSAAPASPSSPPAPSRSGWTPPPKRGGAAGGSPTSASAASVAPVRAQAPVTSPRAQAAAAPVVAVATESVVAVVDAPVLDAVVEERWAQAVEAVLARKRMLGEFLKECRLEGLAGDHIVLAMDSLRRSVIDAAEPRAMVCEELRRLFGRSLDIRCTELGPEGLKRPRTADEVKPLIDRAIEFFDGEVLGGGGRGDRTT